jgi:hypothetical protein
MVRAEALAVWNKVEFQAMSKCLFDESLIFS